MIKKIFPAVRKAVIPAAGFGTRFLPFTRAVPKEMIPLVDKPVIQYVVEEAAAAGIEDILIKTWNHLAVDISKIKCDAYEYEQGDLVAINSFHGEYLVNYSWAEFTTARYTQMELN